MTLAAWVGFGQYFCLSVITSCLMTEWLLGRVHYSCCIGTVMSLQRVCAGGLRTFPLLFFFFQSRWARITWTDTKVWALSERGFPWLPHCHKNSYYCLPVLLPVNPAAEAYEGKTWFSGIVACNILQKNWVVLHDAPLRSYVRPVQSPEQFRRVRVQTLLKVLLNMAQTWCSGPLRGADLIYCLTADCTTVAFPRVICSVQAMEVNYNLHKCSWKAAKINK